MNWQEQAALNERNKRIERRTMHLGSLRSVSAAFKATVKEEPLYVPRQGTQEATRDPAQASNPRRDGGFEALPNIPNGTTIHWRPATTYVAGQTVGNVTDVHEVPAGNGQLVPHVVAVGTGPIRPTTAPIDQPASTPKPQPKIIQAGEIVAWRAWTPFTTRLRSVSAGNVWEPDTPMTENYPGQDLRGGGGVHAFKTRHDAARHFSRYAYVIGEVELWGEVIEHQDGYRAQFGAVRSLVDGPSSYQLDSLRRIYGVHRPTPPRPLEASDSSGFPVLFGTIAATVLLAFVLLTNAFVKGPPSATPYYGGYSTTK